MGFEIPLELNCRFDELNDDHKVSVIKLINHMASFDWKYREDVCGRLDKISIENPLAHEPLETEIGV